MRLITYGYAGNVVEILGGPWRRLLRVEVKGEGEGCRKIVVG